MITKLLFFFLILAGIGAGWYFGQRGKSQPVSSTDFPLSVKQKAHFPLYYPSGNVSPFQLDVSSVKLASDPKDPHFQGLSFVLVEPGNKITISEQLTPDVISEQAGLDKLNSLMRSYQELVTSLGRVTLTRPKELKGGQAAVTDPNFTTLIIAKPEKDLTDDQWRLIFNSLALVR